jgi:hypothetical protein
MERLEVFPLAFFFFLFPEDPKKLSRGGRIETRLGRGCVCCDVSRFFVDGWRRCRDVFLFATLAQCGGVIYELRERCDAGRMVAADGDVKMYCLIFDEYY